MGKKVVFAILIFLIGASPLLADEVDDKLSNMASKEIRERTREMIRSGISEDNAIELTRRMIQNQFTHEHILRVQEMIGQSGDNKLPPEPLINKVHEGISKQIKPEKIIRAMEKVRTRYEYAYELSNEITQDNEQKQKAMEEIAASMAAGMTDHDVGRIMEHLKYRAEEMSEEETTGLACETFGAVKDMARMNVQSVKSADVALEAIAHRYGINEMKELRSSFIKHSLNTSPNTVADGYIETIKQGGRVKNLDFSGTNFPGKRSGGGGTTTISGGGSMGSGGQTTGSGAGSSGGSRGGSFGGSQGRGKNR